MGGGGADLKDHCITITYTLGNSSRLSHIMGCYIQNVFNHLLVFFTYNILWKVCTYNKILLIVLRCCTSTCVYVHVTNQWSTEHPTLLSRKSSVKSILLLRTLQCCRNPLRSVGIGGGCCSSSLQYSWQNAFPCTGVFVQTSGIERAGSFSIRNYTNKKSMVGLKWWIHFGHQQPDLVLHLPIVYVRFVTCEQLPTWTCDSNISVWL